MPDEIAERIIGGMNPVKAWRLHSGFTLRELASRAGIPPARLERCEGRSRLLEEEAQAIADALGIGRSYVQRYRGEFRGCVAALEDVDVDELER
ncbi:helix-turn-helix transcriptional regulator [Sphingosinicella sp. CPCC 101087]|uniref:helix-turn-helix domain-containing protein n=1 Tax=Sphingosinicella sp. CPCC 101087 TaxID=2497754 RepID=UPI00101D37B2|nr:helix-turn-helix transcriptional regulator [Sphingosinicella sp. CPCC 101087]